MVGRLVLILISLVISPAFSATDNPITSHSEPADRRVALVIGNGAYQEIGDRLDNPANDARAMADHLRSLNIEVIEAIDLDYQRMRTALRKFDRALKGAAAGLFYYAGHGMEFRGRNYLFPTDSVLESEGDLGLGLVDMGQVLQLMEAAVPTRLVFLDACRNNPLASGFRSSLGASRSMDVGQGLGQMDAAVGTFIAYATAPGQLAADGKEKHSPFTAAMLQHLTEPGLEISQLMHKVRNTVIDVTNARQVPWESSSLRGPFILNLGPANGPSSIGASMPSGSNDSQRLEMVYWESIQNSDDITSFQTYLEHFGKRGAFAPLAEARIQDLQLEQAGTQEASLNFDRQRIQEALTTLGYDLGAADGVFGERTRAVIKTWQRENHNEASGYLTKDQIASILSSARLAASPTAVKRSTSLNGGPAVARSEMIQTRRDVADVRAARLYQVECSRGYAPGCGYLGYYYEKGLGLEQDHAKASKYYREACDGGYGKSCRYLGRLYEIGLGVNQDKSKAAELYKKGCTLNVTLDCTRPSMQQREPRSSS